MKHFCLIFLVLLCTNLVKAQNTPTLTESLQKLESYHNNYPREKVYLHLDKPYYSIGEQIWFKAYLTIGNYNFLSSLSKILYVELINPNDEVAISVRLPVLSGITFGDILLTDSLSEGNYRIRAYSNWMRNFDEKYYFDKTIQIGNALKNPILAESSFSIIEEGDQKTIQSTITFRDLNDKPLNDTKVDYSILSNRKSVRQGKGVTDENGNLTFNFKEPKGGLSNSAFINTEIQTEKRKIAKRIPIKNMNSSTSVKFFPENGENLIAGVLNKVVYKISENEGRGLEAEGIVVDSNNKQISEFKSDFAGIGSFTFHPESGQSYKAIVTFTDNKKEEINLPEVEAQGYIISANTWSSSQVFIQITKNPNTTDSQGLNLILQKGGEVFYAAKIKITDNQSTISLPKDKLPQGLVEARLLTDNMQTLASRELFIYNENRELPLVVTTDKKQYTSRDLVKVELNTGKENDSIRVASLSVSVTDLNKAPVDTLTETTINSYLNLSSETSNYIQSPNYYFRSNDFNIKSQLDNLILTFGKDSVWQAIKKPEEKPQFTPEQNLKISGKITRLNGKPSPFANILLLVGGTGNIIDTVANEQGEFAFDRLLFYEDTKFIIQARDEKGGKNVEIVLDEVPNQQVSKNKNEADITLSENLAMDSYIKDTQKRFEELIKAGKMDNSILLEDVTVTAVKKNPAKNSSNLNGAGNADQVLGEDDLKSCSDLSTCLQGRLMGVIFKSGVPYSTRSPNTPMQIIMDGMYMSEDALSSISPLDVAAVEVLRRPGTLGIYGSMGSGGVIIITTKIGNGSYRNLYTPGIVTYSPQGLYEVKEFTSPDYSVEQTNKEEQDLRSTIYWNPNIITDENGKSSFEFYTADQPGRYRIVVEGIDLNGRIGRSETFIDIVK